MKPSHCIEAIRRLRKIRIYTHPERQRYASTKSTAPHPIYINIPLNPPPTFTIPLATNKLGPFTAAGPSPLNIPVPTNPSPVTFPLPFKIANLKSTSKHVTHILITINTIIIQVMRVIFLSDILSLKISPKSRKTWQRSLSTWMRGLISRYSRTAV